MEDEANEIPVADPKPPGMNSFLDMDDDNDGYVDGNHNAKDAPKKPDRNVLPQYDTSVSTSVNFSSEVISTTVRPGAFLPVPGDLEDPSEASSCDHEVDLPSLHDGIVSIDSDLGSHCSPYDGIVELDSFETGSSQRIQNPYLAKPPRSPLRYCVSDTTCLAESLHVSLPPLLSRLSSDGRASSSSVILRRPLLQQPMWKTKRGMFMGMEMVRRFVPVRPSILRELEDPCEDLSCNYEVDLPSYYDGMASTNSEFEFDRRCFSCDGVAATVSELDLSCSPYDGIVATDSKLHSLGSP